MKKFFFLFFIFLSFNFNAQMAGPLANGSLTINSAPGTTWAINPWGASVDLSASYYSNGLVATNFSFAIPLTSTIVGVEVIPSYSVTYVADTIVRLVVNTVETGSNKGLNIPMPCCSFTYGASNDVWGVSSLIPLDVNSINFGVVLYVKRSTGPSNVMNMFYPGSPPPFQIKVYYTSVTGITETQSSYSGTSVYSFNKKLYINSSSDSKISIYNGYFALFIKNEIAKNLNELDLSDLPSGIYFYQIEGQNKVGKIYIE